MQGVVGETWGCLNDEFVCSVQDRSYWLTLLHCTWGIFGGKTCFECFVFFFFVRIFCRTLAKIYWLRLLQFPMNIGKFLEGKLKHLKKLVTFFFSFFFTLCWFIDFPLFYSLMLGGNFFIKKVMLLKWLIDHGFLFNLIVGFFFFFIFLHFFFFFFLKIHSRVMKSK